MIIGIVKRECVSEGQATYLKIHPISREILFNREYTLH